MSQPKASAHEIAKDYWRVAQELGRSPTRAEYAASGIFPIEKIILVFGSWIELTRAVKRSREIEEPEIKRDPKILVVDLECLPMELYGYGLYDQNFSVRQIKVDSSMASFSAQWLGEKEIIYNEVNWRKDPRDDRKLAKHLWDLMSLADIIVGQNSIAFDAKVANERFLRYNLGPTPPVSHIDTKRESKRHFRFPSHSLEYMADRYAQEKKEKSRKFHGIDLQIACLAKNPEAWKEMKLYNMQDVRATAALYLKIRPWGTRISLSPFQGSASFNCESCGGDRLQRRGERTNTTGRFHRYQCQTCGHWQSEKGAANNLMSKKKRASLRGPI